MLIRMFIVQFRFRNKKHIETFNKFGKHFIFVSKGLGIKVTYHYSVWIPQMLMFDVWSLADCSNKFEKPKQIVSFKKGELVMLLRLFLSL